MSSLRLLPILALLLLTSCTAAVRRPAFAPGSIAWPPAPDPPRLVLSELIGSPEEAGIERGFFGKLWYALVGEEDRSIRRPYGVFADSRQRLVVVDPGRRGVHIFDRGKGNYEFVQGPEGGSFLSPIGVSEDQVDRLYLTDSAAGIVYRLKLDDLAVEQFVPAGVLKRPTGIAYNPTNGMIYVVDTVGAQVHAFDQAGRERHRFGGEGRGPGLFNHPTDLAVDRKGRVLVTDALNGRIELFSKEGKFLREFGEPGDSIGHFAKPKGVAVDSSGDVYVCDSLLDAVQVFDGEGRLLMVIGGAGGGPGEFWMPSGLFIDGDDAVYVADTYNRRIQLLRRPSGEDRHAAEEGREGDARSDTKH